MWQSSGLGSGRTPRDRSSNAGSRPGSAVKRLNLELNFETRSGRSTPGAVPSLSPLRDEFYGTGGGRGVSATVGPPTPDERGVIVAPHPSDPTAVIASRSKEARDANPDRLDLDRRELSQCPELIDEHRLRLLNYQHNAITRISRLETVRNLVFLDLYANAVEKIAGLERAAAQGAHARAQPNQIHRRRQRAQRLDVLDLHNNEIASTSGLNSLASLRILNLAGNRLVSLGDLGNMTGLHELNARRNEIGDLARRGGARGDLVDPRIFPEPRLPPNLRRIFLSHNKVAAPCHVAPLRDLGYLEELALDGCPVDARPGYRSDVVDSVSPAVRVLDGAGDGRRQARRGPVSDGERPDIRGIGDRGKLRRGRRRWRGRGARWNPAAAAAAVPARTSVVNIGLGPGDDEEEEEEDDDDEGVSDGSYSDGEVYLNRRVLRATEESAATAAAEEEGTAASSTIAAASTTAAAAAITRPSSQDRPRGARELVSSSR